MPWVPGLTLHILTHERARAGRHSLVEALAEFARTHALAGMSVLRGVEGISGAGYLRSASVIELSDDLPLLVEIVDRAERLEPLLGEIAALCPHEVLSVTESRVYFPVSRLVVCDVMSAPRTVVRAPTSLSEALAMLIEGGVRMLPVVDADGVLVGVLTLGHLLRAADPALPAHVLDLLPGDPSALRTHLEAHMAGQTVGQHMARPFLVFQDATLEVAARMLIAHHLTRAPVVNDERTLVGVVGERALVAALIAPLQAQANLPGEGHGNAPGAHEEARQVGEALRRMVLPGAGAPPTAGMLADRSAPCLRESATLAEVAEAMRTAREGVVCVVDAEGRARGIVDEHAALAHLLPGAHSGQAALRSLFARSPARILAILGQRQEAPIHADVLLQVRAPLVTETLPLAEALARMLASPPGDLALVVDADCHPLGILWREDALRALLGG